MTAPAAPLCPAAAPRHVLSRSHGSKPTATPSAPTVPIDGAAELVLDALRVRRQELAARAPEALTVTAVALGAMKDAAHGHVPEIAADRLRRYRSMQLHGEKVLPLEDLAAIALTSERGRGVALAGLRALAGALDHVVLPAAVPEEPFVTAVVDAAAALQAHCRGLVAF